MLVNDLQHAAARGQFVLHYQPQIATKSGVITGSKHCCAGTTAAWIDLSD
jgi:EAL domain-containing protein (putative c-di-GMP-specific phosphodiesterase class I)